MGEAMAKGRGMGEGRRDPFVSIIIPTHNPGKYLQETLASCLKVKGLDLEIILVDDASTDGVPQSWQQRHPSIRFHSLHTNSAANPAAHPSGQGGTGSGSVGRNAGLALARGRYVKFLDQDDLLQPRGFQAECREALRTDADIVMASWGVVSMDDQGRFRKQTLRLFHPPDPDRLVEAILMGEATPYTAAALYKRSFVANDQWDSQVAIIDDYDWFCRQALKGGQVVRVGELAYFWRLHPHSIQGRSQGEATLFRRLTLARCKVYMKIEQLLREQGRLTGQRGALLARRYYECLRCHARYAPREMRQLLWRIQALDPGFVVDSRCERAPRAVWLIRRIGLANFLRGYGLVRRIGDAARAFRPPGVAAPDRG